MSVRMATFGGMANNCYLIVDDETNQSALVDCSAYNDTMLDLIGDTDLQYILLTHGHYDHILGAKAVKDKFGCKICIGEADAEMLTSARYSLAVFTPFEQENVEADILLHDGDVITLGRTKIQVISTPGHTKGGVCYISGDSLFVGDTLFRLSYGRTDFPGGSWEEMQQSLQKLAALDGNYTVYTGHEETSTLDFERKYNEFMRTL